MAAVALSDDHVFFLTCFIDNCMDLIQLDKRIHEFTCFCVIWYKQGLENDRCMLENGWNQCL